MPMEQETMGMLSGGFSIVMGIAVIFTIFLWVKNKKQSIAYSWIFMHFVLFSIAIYLSFQTITFDNDHPMAAEEISLRLGLTGVFWFLSVVCLLLGIFKFSKTIKVI
jgi:uncharacterized membrane protein